MNASRRFTLAVAALACGAAVASGPDAGAITPASQPAASTAAQQPASSAHLDEVTKDGIAAQASRHRQWGPSWISGSYLTAHGKKWVSQPYRSKGRTAYAYLRCYNTNAKMQVRVYNVEAGRYIANSGWTRCNPNTSIKTGTTSFQRLDHLRIVVNGDQGSYVSAYYKK
ncbi:hypothetical protein ACF1BE_13495 [Streptomyces sp. NPDC014991]|uniref:hypothetical protein n=1 Tax=Streptomyces sp. NPDC014991 TaxID=3364935 RepID=UPI0036F9A74D